MATKKNLIPVDLEGSTPDNTVGGFPDIPDDDYLFAVENLESDIDDNDRRWYKVTAYVVNDCPYRGTTFTEKWTTPADSTDDYSRKGRDRFHAWLLAIDVDTSTIKFGIDPDKVRGLKFWSRTYHHTMPESADGRFKERSFSRFGAFSPSDNEEATKRLSSRLPARARKDEDEDEDVKPTKASKRKPVVEDDDEEEDESPKKKPIKKAKPVVEDDDDEEEEDDEDEKPARRRRPTIADDDDDEEEEDEKPAKRKAAAKEAPAKRTKKAAADDDDDEEDEEDMFPSRPVKGKAAASKVAPKGSARRKRDEEDDEDDD